ncbi:hypothetical protein AWC11_23150 [Mycobacterium interjectum]|nr:hypothetical protein AWC11_23150 [Mycobacterium interjectum]
MAELAPVVNTPHPADIIAGPQPHVRHVMAVTEQHGLQVEELEVDPSDIAHQPFRVKGERTVADIDSLLAELDRRPLGDGGTLWGKASAGRLTAIYNDHTTGDPGWRDDKLTLQLAPDEDWAAWHGISGTYLKQGPFGDQIEELLHTVTSPDQAELLEIIDSIRASTSGEFESAIERANGSQKLTYKQEHTVKAGRGGQLEIPQIITLDLRPWEGHPETYEVESYFRTRVQDGALWLAVKLKPTRQIVREAWYAVTQAVVAQTGKTVLAVQ